MAGCCPCCPAGSQGSAVKASPLICLVPRDKQNAGAAASAGGGRSGSGMGSSNFQILDEAYIRKHFKVPPRAMYLDAFIRPLITFPIGQDSKNFNVAKKTKINQMILDGTLDPSEAITAPSIFPFGKSEQEKAMDAKKEEEIIYILQLPDYEMTCPAHKQTIRTPRFLWHSCKKGGGKEEGASMKRGGGPMNRPKPWLLSRHTDFDLMSQW